MHTRINRQQHHIMLIFAAAVFVLAPTISEAAETMTFKDEREFPQVYPFLGFGIDSFAAGSVNDYLNPGESGDLKERFIFGFEFDARLFGRQEDDQQVWIYGRAIHGVRSADVDCKANPDLPVCQPFSADLQNPAERGLYILRNATSLEGMIGARFEFAPLQQGRARAYVGAQAGFIAVTDDDDDVADVHHVAIGARIVQGSFKNSFLEIGYGRNDLFEHDKDKRYKVNARVVRQLNALSGGLGDVSFFAQISTDVDLGKGADSVQTYFGFAYSFAIFNPTPSRTSAASPASITQLRAELDQ